MEQVPAQPGRQGDREPEPPRAATAWPAPGVLVILGASGDLTRRKLIPALFRLDQRRALPGTFRIVGLARRPWSDEAFREHLRAAALGTCPPGLFLGEEWQRFARRLRYLHGDLQDPETATRLRSFLEELSASGDAGPNRLFYLATAPSEFAAAVTALGRAGLVHGEEEGPFARVVVEKPFGEDLASARRLDRLLHSILREDQIYRIDHYLGKETVQNLLVFRFGNAIFDPLWNRRFIDHVQITAAERLGIEGRGRFYDGTGVFRDLVQNHLLQVLALCGMECPVSFSAEDVRDEISKVLRALRPLNEDAVAEEVVAGQYDGYREEDGVDPDSTTPTFAALRVHIDNWRWQGVPFYLRTGKALSSKVTEVAIQFHTVPLALFGTEREAVLRVHPNTLVFRLQPNEGISIGFTAKRPLEELALAPVQADFSYAEAFGGDPPDAYQRLLLDALRGDPTLFIRSDVVATAWEFVDPMLRVWADGRRPAAYARGSAGPAEADRLLARDHRRWRRLA